MPPRIPPRLLQEIDLLFNRLFRGPTSAEVMSEAARKAAIAPAVGRMSSADYAMTVLRQTEIPQDAELGRAAREAPGALDPRLLPPERGEKLLEHQVPGLPKAARPFLPKDAVVTNEEFETINRKALRHQKEVLERSRISPPGKPPPVPPGAPPIPEEPISDPSRLLGARATAKPLRDIGMFARNIGSPGFTLSFNTLGKAIHARWRRARFDSVLRSAQQEDELKEAADLLASLSPAERRTSSAKLYEVVNGIEGTPEFTQAWRKLSSPEKRAAGTIRNFLRRWVELRDDVLDQVADQSVTSLRKKMMTRFSPTQRRVYRDAFRETFKRKGLIEQAGMLTWRKSDFLHVDKFGQVTMGSFPFELGDVNFSGNAAFRHLLQGMEPKADIIEPLRAITAGMIRRDIQETAWREMQIAGKGLPPLMRGYLRQWLRELRGVPGVWSEGFDLWVQEGQRRLGTLFPVTGATELSSFLLSGFYRGALAGNLNFYLANFFGQGFLNTAAKHGPYSAFWGIAQHFRRPLEGVLPRESLMGGFEAIFGKEIPRSEFGRKLLGLPGAKELRSFAQALGREAGPTQSEYINRSIGTHVGLKAALDNYNFRNRQANPRWINLSIDDVLQPGKLDEQVRMNLLFQAVMDSEVVNYLYGVDGRNPIIAQMFGRQVIAHTTQFLSWIPKTAEFTFGPVLRDHDFGVLLNYLVLTGWVSKLMAQSWGVDFSTMTLFGARLPQREFIGLPVGPSAQAMILLMRAISTENEVEAKEMWEEFVRTAGLALIPGEVQINRTLRFIQTLKEEKLLTPDLPWELVQHWGPTAAQQPGPVFGRELTPSEGSLAKNLANILRSETPGRALGLPMLSDRMERRFRSEIRRTNSIWRALMQETVDELIKEMQLNGTDTQRFRDLMTIAEIEGLPISGMLEAGMERVLLPRLLRAFRESPKLTQALFIERLKLEYPEIFDPEYMIQPEIPEEFQQGLGVGGALDRMSQPQLQGVAP